MELGTLTGSEKQVAWATEIRATMLGNLQIASQCCAIAGTWSITEDEAEWDACVARIEQYLDQQDQYHRHANFDLFLSGLRLTGTAEAFQACVDTIAANTDATWWIESRTRRLRDLIRAAHRAA